MFRNTRFIGFLYFNSMNRSFTNFILLASFSILLYCQRAPESKVETSQNDWYVQVDSFQVFSDVMQKEIPASIILPSAYLKDTSRQFPVVYLLHGYSGNHRSWINRVPDLKNWADRLDLILVLPDGQYNAWYLDSPMLDSIRFGTFTAKELPNFIDQNYRSRPTPNGRGITGLSMGGHGALFLSAQYPKQFGIASSMSGGLDLRPFPNNWELSNLLGTLREKPENWDRYSVINMLDAFQENPIPILIDCGLDDFFVEANQATHQKMLAKGIDHDFILRPGAHNWEYWDKILPYHLLFFHEFFYNESN